LQNSADFEGTLCKNPGYQDQKGSVGLFEDGQFCKIDMEYHVIQKLDWGQILAKHTYHGHLPIYRVSSELEAMQTDVQTYRQGDMWTGLIRSAFHYGSDDLKYY